MKQQKIIERKSYSLKVDVSLFSSIEKDEAILCLNYGGLYGINNINKFLQESNPNPTVKWDIQQYKVGYPILFLESDRFYPIINNNMKGIQIIDEGTPEEYLQFDVEIPKEIDESDARYCDFQLLECSEEEEKSVIRFYVHKLKSADKNGDEQSSRAIVPFQVAYTMSIHKAQGLEYNSVKIVITDEVEKLVTHNVFYAAITRPGKSYVFIGYPRLKKRQSKE